MRVVPAVPASIARPRLVAEYSFVAYPAPVVAAPALVAAFRTGPLVAWSAPASRVTTATATTSLIDAARTPQVIVGMGAAAELRADGSARWRELIAQARTLIDNAQLIDLSGAGDHLVRPRLLGGVAFAPGAAGAAPWTDFGDAWFVLPRWTYVHDGTQGALIFARRGTERVPANELADLRVALAMPFVSRPQPALTAIDHGDRDAWRGQVRAITDAIARGESTKIVAARSAVVSLAGELRAADMLAELDARHPETVRFLVRPGSGSGDTFVAATPERLVRLADGIASVDALAGSAARPAAYQTTVQAGSDTPAHSIPACENAKALLASGKDRREHAIVVDAIVSALQNLGADVRFPDAPGIRKLRHVLHLHTPITAELRTQRHVLELAEALHPTPAVGGTPTRAAIEWIAEREQTPRGWYSSPVGWFDADGNGELAVAIRSGVLTGDRAHLWAGAGIVAGSDPDRELAETDLKLRAMLGALGVSA
ncbi:MAG TPA: isochorismate synthase [Kofleriaceae bacterium]|nr:isochorismate synthase [Kofleriaceae bacterium]